VSKAAILFRIVAIIFVVEGFIMLGLSMAPEIESPIVEALLDGAFLSLLSATPLYYWVIEPYNQSKTQELQLEVTRIEEAFQNSLTALENDVKNIDFNEDLDPETL